MEALLPLHSKQEKGQLLKLALESSSSLLFAGPRFIIENGKDLVCLCEGPCCSLYRLCDAELLPLGTFLFHRVGERQVFSVIVDEKVSSFPCGAAARAAAGLSAEPIRLSPGGRADFVDFIGDALVVGTSYGCLGMVFIGAGGGQVIGRSVQVQTSGGGRWCCRNAARQCIYLSQGSAVVIAVESQLEEAIVSTSNVDGGALAPAIAASQTACDCYFLAHAGCRDVTLLCAGSDHILRGERLTLLCDDVDGAAGAGTAAPGIYAHGCCGVCLLAVVYPDAVSLTAWDEQSMVSTAAVKNELTSPFGRAFWKPTPTGARLFVLRADVRCLTYDVVMSNGVVGMVEVVVTDQFTLPTPVACLMGSEAGHGAFLCWRGGPALARYSALLQSRTEVDRFELIEVRHTPGHAASAAHALLLEVVPLRGSYGVVCLFSSGACLLSLYNQPGTTLVAREERPHDATSCLAFEGDAGSCYTCVIGFNDGDIRVFVDGQLRANVRVAHCGAVDRLLRLPKINETDDTLFVSVSTEMGTVCFHSGDTAAVSRTMCSPSKPLTACLLDGDLEYMFLFSEGTGNLWHLPTCRLERAFRTPQGVLDRRLDNLLQHHWASATSVLRFRFVGSEHYAIRIDVDSLVSSLQAAPESQPRPTLEFGAALGLLLRCLGEPHPAFILSEDVLGAALDDLGLAAAGVYTYECTWCAMVLLAGLLLRTTDGVTAAAVYSVLESLGGKLAACPTPDPGRLADTLQLFFSRFYTLRRATPAPFRHALRLMANNLPKDSLRAVLRTLQSRVAAAPASCAADDVASSGWPLHLATGGALGALLALSSLAEQRGDGAVRGDAALMEFLRRCMVDAQRTVAATLDGDQPLLRRSETLLGLVESFATVCAVDEKGPFQGFVRALVKEAFGGKVDEAKQAALEALERLVAQDAHAFLSTYIVTNFHLHAEYRPYVVVFLAHLVKNFPFEAHTAFGAMADIAIGGLSSLASAAKDEATIYQVAVSQLIRVAAASLPSVSLQWSLQHLAVGRRDGKVAVYNVKSASIVTTFQAHATAVLGVAYSGNITALDIATVAETMDEIKVWRSPSPSSSLASFFSGSSGTSFKLVTSVEVPSIALTPASTALLIKHIRLTWLSPQCVEFSSPWHGKIQASLP